MKVNSTFLRSKVARRIFFLFVLCALVPIGALSVVSFKSVTKYLNEQSIMRRQQACKLVGYTIVERLIFLEKNLRLIQSEWLANSSSIVERTSDIIDQGMERRFNAVVLSNGVNENIPLLRHIDDLPYPTEAEQEFLASGQTLFSCHKRPGFPPRLFISMILEPRSPGKFLIAEINPEFLWNIMQEKSLVSHIEVCILDPSNNVLYSSHPIAESFAEAIETSVSNRTSGSLKQAHTGRISWNNEEEEHLGTYWSLFLKSNFYLPKLTIVMSEARSFVMAPITEFKVSFLLVLLLTFWIILFLSLNQIRRSLIHLERLQVATKRIARKEFRPPLNISSGDEFQEVAESFNEMALQLERQFNVMRTISEIDREILSVLDQEKIVSTLLTRMDDIIHCEGVSVTLISANPPHLLKTYTYSRNLDTSGIINSAPLTSEEVQQFMRHPEYSFIDRTEDLPRYLEPLSGCKSQIFILLPIFIKKKLSGILCISPIDLTSLSQEDLKYVRQSADQIGVALSNAILIDELARTNWGTLIALARAIDAKSPWTSGHSERVTDLAIQIAQAMNVPKEEIRSIHRGGLLHDIGKIGVPAHILDKPEDLTEDEWRVMRNHVHIGARILDPIESYDDVLPIILQHHEWFDGTGYPEGLAGEEIDLKARIFAVADCYDALSTDRPYRTSLNHDGVIDFIKRQAGIQFDPKVVQCFLKIIGQETKANEEASLDSGVEESFVSASKGGQEKEMDTS